MLHVTNGDIVREQVEQAGLAGAAVAWNDVLHEGPVPAGLSVEQLRDVRARFIGASGWAREEDARRELERRDGALAAEHDRVVLWFEADLYDQLQLIEVLDRLARDPVEAVSLVGVDGYLTDHTPSELADLFAGRPAVTDAQLELASQAWAAFRSPDPTAIELLLETDTSPLPFLADALRRHLEQFPALDTGLARTERQILEAIAAGARTRDEVFARHQEREGRVFMGDTTLWSYLGRLCEGRAPLLASENGSVSLAAAGEAVLAGRADAVALNGIDRWLGGVHLHGEEAAWRWDRARRRLVPA